MFSQFIEAISRLDGAQSPSEIPEDIVHLLPDEITAQDVVKLLAESSDADSITTLSATCAILQSGRRITHADGDEDALNETADRIGSSILPVKPDASPDEATPDSLALAHKGLLGLRSLQLLADTYSLHLRPQTLLCIAAYADANTADAWTSPSTSQLAQELLASQLGARDVRAKFITETILTQFLRPLFSAARPPTVTASGRKAEFVETPRYTALGREEEETKPWKYGQRYAVAVFAWAVREADKELLRQHWHLFTPVLLTLLDETQPALKIRALGIFRAFWARCPANLMRNTGLAEVFEQAVFPTVLYLPSLTPEDESVALLDAAYPVLMEMAGIDPTITADEPQNDPQFTEAQHKLLDKIIREGVVVGYHHAREHIRLVELFCEKLRCIINGMGILAIKHLKDFIPMVSEIMMDPFGTKYPPALFSANQLLQSILRTCWPRMAHYSNEIIQILVLCWLNIEGEDTTSNSPITSKLKPELTKTADMLAAVMKAAEVDINERAGALIEKEPQLVGLFRERGDAI